jgi:hypothetical protein
LPLLLHILGKLSIGLFGFGLLLFFLLGYLGSFLR